MVYLRGAGGRIECSIDGGALLELVMKYIQVFGVWQICHR
jgi:hypothetical protein